MATRSLIIRVRVERAQRAHDCQADSRHRLERGDIRLKVRDGIGWVHYCKSCAENIIFRDLEKLRALQSLTPEETLDPE